MSNNQKPDFYKTLINPSFYEKANKQIKYIESPNYWIFKTGVDIFKVKKKIDHNSPLHLEQMFCEHIIKLSKLYSPENKSELFYLIKQDEEYILSSSLNNSNDFFVVIRQSQHHEKDNLLEQIKKNKVSETDLDSLIDRLIEFHHNTNPISIREHNESEQVERELENLFYQSKKYLGFTISQPLIDLTQRPLKKFVETQKKLFNKRNKAKKVKEIHGCLKPKKIFLNKGEVAILDNRYSALKDRVSDVLSDLADLTIEFDVHQQHELSEKIVERYKSLSKDKDINIMLPFYTSIKALKQGLHYSTLAKNEEDEEKQQELVQYAKKYYESIAGYVKKLSF